MRLILLKTVGRGNVKEVKALDEGAARDRGQEQEQDHQGDQRGRERLKLLLSIVSYVVGPEHARLLNLVAHVPTTLVLPSIAGPAMSGTRRSVT